MRTFIYCFALSLVAVLVSTAPDVLLTRGFLRGVDEGAQATGKPLHAYYGIPFAQPPVGGLRFQPPRPFFANDQNQRINSDSFRPACVQLMQEESLVSASQSEDCLYLNVYTPSVGDGASFNTNDGRKVMVWIHGGAYTIGDASIYRPTRLVTDYDVIVVTIQYRLGVFGFLSSGDEALPGNYGLRDQILGLQWVKDNIRLFGGDPNDVTIFGESAGGSSVSLLGLSPLTRGLFTKSIMQSGVALSHYAVNRNPLDTFYKVAEKAKCLPFFFVPAFKSLMTGYHQQIVQCLQRLGASQLNKASMEDESLNYDAIREMVVGPNDEDSKFFAPVIDGDVLPRDPFSLVEDPDYLARIGALDRKYIIGFNNNEMAGLAPSILSDKEVRDKLSDADNPLTQTILQQNVQSVLPLPVTSDVLNFASLIYLYPRDWQGRVPFQGLVDLMNDVTFVVPAVRKAQALVKASPSLDVYLYVFDHYPQVTNPDISLQGSTHALDLAYLFEDNQKFKPLFSFYEDLYTPSDLPLLDVFRGSLTNMAKSGNPSRIGASPWPRYDLENQSYMSISPRPEVRQRVYERRISFWTDFLPRVAGAIFKAGPGRKPFRV